MSAQPDPSPKDLVKSSYDKIAPAYQDFITNLPSPNLTWSDKLLAALPSPTTARILELGCGPGIPVTKYLASKVGSVVANDISPAQIALAGQNLSSCSCSSSNISFKQGDMTSLHFTDAEAGFDAIVAIYSLQHLPRDEQREMLRRIYGWLKPGGGMVLCNFGEDEDPGSVMEDWLGARMFSSGFGVEGSIEMVERVGFEVVEKEVVRMVEGERTVPFLWVLARRK